MLWQLPLTTLVLWGSATLLTLALLSQVVTLGQFRSYPFFALYLVVNLLQTIVGIFLYQGYGFNSHYAFVVAWTTQAFVVVARALAAAEVCHAILGRYKGIWGLAARVLSVCALISIGLSLYFGRHNYHIGTVTLEIALEACISTGIAGLFLFTKYYELHVAKGVGLLGLGLGLLSCARILNDVVFARFLGMTGTKWNEIASLTFVAVLVVWIWAVRHPVPAVVPAVRQLSSGQIYADMIPAMNQRLAELNDQLTRLWRLEQPKS